MKTILATNRGIEFYQRMWSFSSECKCFFNIFNKKRKNKRLHFFFLIFFTFFCCCNSIFGQFDPQLSQNFQFPVIVNSSLAGGSGRANLFMLNRTQWVSIDGAPKTTVIGADMSTNFLNNKGGLGLVLQNDEIGYFDNITIQALASQHYEVFGEGRVSVGINLGIVNQSFDGSKIILKPSAGGDYHEDNDFAIPSGEVEGTAFDMGLGVWYSQIDYYIGASVLHLFAPKPNFKDQLDVYVPRSFYLIGGYNYKFNNRDLELNPALFLKYSGNSIQTDFNVNLVISKNYWTGISYRIDDAIVILAGLELKNGIRFSYSYDITTSALSRAGSRGSHEIAVGYVFDIYREKREKRYKSVRYL